MKDSTAITLQKNKVMVHEDATAIIVILSFVDRWFCGSGVCVESCCVLEERKKTRGKGLCCFRLMTLVRSQLADTTFAIQSQPVRILVDLSSFDKTSREKRNEKLIVSNWFGF